MPDIRLEDACRPEAWAGEIRVNLVRAVALAAFYAYHLLDVYVLKTDPSAGGEFHLRVTLVTLTWVLLVVLLHLLLSRRFAPPWLGFFATAWDLALVTALCSISPLGPASPLVLLYFLVIAASPLRFSLPLVYATTLGAMVAVTLLLGYHVFIQLGPERYYAEGQPRIPRSTQAIFLLSLGTAGLLAGQIVRQAQRLAQGYPVRVEEEGGTQP
jgi:hypothetical protein